jgi:glutamate--cysteine ligase
MPHGTSLRMGRLGYQSDAQASLAVSYNCLESYADSLQDALTRPYPAYEAIGVQNPGGDYNQLSTSLLQIENEFYGTIRPKRVIRSGERPLHALRERGVEYVEVRCMDLDPFVPVGIAAPTVRFLDVFLLHCLLSDSPPDTPEEIRALGQNQHLVAARGREPGLRLQTPDGGSRTLQDWGTELLDGCAPMAAALDAAHGGHDYRDALAAARRTLAEPDSTPSARVLAAMARSFDDSYIGFIRQQSEATRAQLLDLPYSAELAQRFAAQAAESLAEQTRIEQADTLPFETYRQHYLAPERMEV